MKMTDVAHTFLMTACVKTCQDELLFQLKGKSDIGRVPDIRSLSAVMPHLPCYGMAERFSHPFLRVRIKHFDL